MFSLFYSLWCNPETKVHKIVKYLLQWSNNNSRSWSMNMKHISKLYGIEDPLTCLQRDPPEKSQYKKYTSDKINTFYEKELRQAASQNSRMKYFNVSLFGLSGRLHHAIGGNIKTSSEVDKMKPHLKFLSVDNPTFKIKSSQSGGPAVCRICRK